MTAKIRSAIAAGTVNPVLTCLMIFAFTLVTR